MIDTGPVGVQGRQALIRVLHLEDSAIDADLVLEHLEQVEPGCAVERVWTRDDFVALLGSRPFDLILADHQLPMFDGDAALDLARELAPDTPFIFVSGTLGEDVAVEALKRGATDYVIKQRLHRLPDVVERALHEATERTQRRRAEAELRELNEELERRVQAAVAERQAIFAQLAEVQKFETLGQLTGGVAHDFNNLLTPILGNLDLLRLRSGEDARATRLVNGAIEAAERARTLVQRLLAFSRRQVLEPRAVDTVALVQGMHDLIARTIGPQIALAVESAESVAPARVDPAQLELALLNLVVNARDAMPGGGRIAIAIDVVEQARDRGGLERGRYVRIAVSDTGIGMDALTLKRAIEPFFSTKGIGKGTGLGLSMVHGLAAQSGGQLAIESRPGEGTRAAIWLPVTEEAIDEARAPLPAAEWHFPPATVLLVDDDDLVRAGTREMLRGFGFTVVEAGSAHEALDVLDRGLAPDLLVTDYLMPDMTGTDMLIELGRRGRRLKVLLITGYAALTGDQIANLPLLAKPFRRDELAERIAGLLADAGEDTCYAATA